MEWEKDKKCSADLWSLLATQRVFGSASVWSVIHHNTQKRMRKKENGIYVAKRDLHITTLFKLNQPDQNQWRCGHKKIMEKYAN